MKALIAAIALVTLVASPTFAQTAPNTETQSQTTPLLHEGDLVQLRSGGPALTVKSVRGNWVIATWWNEGFGEFQSAGFPRDMVDGPITHPAAAAEAPARADAGPQASRSARSADR